MRLKSIELGTEHEVVRLNVIPQHPKTTPAPVEVEVTGPLLAGPIGSRVAIFDYNRDIDRLLPPATPSPDGTFPAYDIDDVRFHQCNVYAIVARAIELVELELGRGLSWGFEGNRLMALPHAGQWNNAFYSEDTHSLQFFSFGLPDKTIYHTCLVHDIVAHETGHALLDAVRDRYTEGNEPETGALHEAVGDLTAIFAALSHGVVRDALLEEAGDDLRNDNAVASIAEEFEGEENEGRSPLRNLTRATTTGFAGVVEPHLLSLKLTQAIWEGIARIYDLNVAAGDTKQDALRLATEASQRMVLRAFDYLPPADGTFEDFAESILLSDAAANPSDVRGYRPAVAQAFVSAGIGSSASDLMPPTDPSTWRLPPNWPRITPSEAYSFLDAHRNRLALDPHAEYRDFVCAFQVTRKPPDLTDLDQVLFVYEYPVDVEFRGKRFADLDGEWLTIWGGGTLVFGVDGVLRSHAEKPITRERIRRTMDFIAAALDTGDMTLTASGEQEIARRNFSPHPFLADVSGQTVVIRSNPSARCGKAGNGDIPWL
jgi:hypothetical protein